MIEYFYSLDYQAEDHHPAHEVVPSDRIPAINDSESKGTFVKPFSQESHGEMDQDSSGTIVGPVEDSVTIFDPLSLHILMYSLADRMLIGGPKALSKAKVERELLLRLDSNTFPRSILFYFRDIQLNSRK